MAGGSAGTAFAVPMRKVSTMTIAMLHVIAHLPHAWHVTTWRHGWYAWRQWPHAVEAFGRTRGILCGYLRARP